MYVDNIIIKSKIIDSHVMDLTKTFQVLKRFKMCLNLSICTFGVSLRKFIGFIVHKRGIYSNPEQV